MVLILSKKAGIAPAFLDRVFSFGFILTWLGLFFLYDAAQNFPIVFTSVFSSSWCNISHWELF
jgi:hypothetical protein